MILTKFSTNVEDNNNLEKKITDIDENEKILKNNIEYLRENDKFLKRKQYMLFIFVVLLFVIGAGIIISFFYNIYLMFK